MLSARDGIGISGIESLSIRGISDSQFLIIEVPL